MKIQVTLFCNNGKYRPLSTLIEAPTVEEFKANFDEYKRQAILKIANQRYRDGLSLFKSGYTIIKWRIYNPTERKAYALEKIKKRIM